MAASKSPTRRRILDTGARLFRRNGYTGTGLKQITGEAGAPFGSLYHFFPGGKRELAAEIIRTEGAGYARTFDVVRAEDAVAGLRAWFAGAAEVLEAGDYADACPIAAIALEVASTDDDLRQATAEVFTDWIEQAAARFTEAGIAPARARTLAVSAIASLEGAFVLARALRSPEPVLSAGEIVVAAVERELAS
ncbi:TetR/AcrR family transcriptional regulator [Phytomonospora sp. NPDC050363]|uniref:TetR/AcrR family transcriptional regulator n=1 Tax=Phytomonospora sp. NPDC050363 TaxID=3155642 RepID=UPI003404AA8C